MEVNQLPQIPEEILLDITNRIAAPWMMLPEETESNKTTDENLKKVCNLSTRETYHHNIPEISQRSYIGSSFGWLLTMGRRIHLFNPLTREQILLPSNHTLKHKTGYYQRHASSVSQFALSSKNPNIKPDCVVMVIYSSYSYSKLAFATPKSKSWTIIKSADDFHDVVFFKGSFYAVTIDRGLRVCNIDSSPPRTNKFTVQDLPQGRRRQFYLFEMSGNLCLVERSYNTRSQGDHVLCVATRFKVYKLDFDNRMWTRVYDLGNNAVFIGFHSSFSVSTCVYPQLKQNRIYFRDDDDFYKSGEEMGIYDYGKKEFEDPHQCSDIVSSSFGPAIFFMSSFA